MSEKPYQWGHEHFCEPDVVALHERDPSMAVEHGYPTQLEAPPTPATFCSVCLEWFDDPAHLVGSDHRPPEGHEI